MNSQTPSEANIINLSDSTRFISVISGIALTPTSAAAWSPNDLDMARPGMSSWRCHTLAGPNGLPLMSLYAATLPPLDNILYYSSGSSALWSLFRGIPINLWVFPPGPLTSFLLAKTALESPTFAQKTLFPTIRTETHVDPENLKLIPDCLKRPSVTLPKDLSNCSLTSVESTTLWFIFAWSNVYLIDCSTSFAKTVLTYSLTSLPFTPWPSATAKKWVLLYSPRWGKTKNESWFVLFGFFGEYPVLVANANFVTQLSNFLLVYLG